MIIYSLNTFNKYIIFPNLKRFFHFFIFPRLFWPNENWTYFLCPFLKNFSSLVQIRIEEITNLIYAIIDKKKSIMVSQKNDPKIVYKTTHPPPKIVTN